MIQENDGRVLSAEGIDIYMRHLREQERSAATISKYACDLEMVRRHFAGKELTKDALIRWKEGLKEKYAATSVNTMIAALNGFLKFMEWFDLIVKDISRLADILGHSNVNTTRIYTMESGAVHARQIEALAQVIT